jgi:hypothetical protein
MAVRPSGADGEPKAGAGGETTTTCTVTGGTDVPGLAPVDMPAKGGEPDEAPGLPPRPPLPTSMSLRPSLPRSGHLVGWCFSLPLQIVQ